MIFHLNFKKNNNNITNTFLVYWLYSPKWAKTISLVVYSFHITCIGVYTCVLRKIVPWCISNWIIKYQLHWFFSKKRKKEKRKKLHWLVIVLIGCIFIPYHFLFSYSTLWLAVDLPITNYIKKDGNWTRGIIKE